MDFFRKSSESSIIYTERILVSGNLTDDKRQLTHSLLEELKNHEWIDVTKYDPTIYDRWLISELTNINREISKKTPLPTITTLYNLAAKRNFKIRFQIELTEVSVDCQCTCTTTITIAATKLVSVSLDTGAKKNAKELSAKQMLQLLK